MISELIYSRFGVICELESAHAVPPHKQQCDTTVGIKRKLICVHFDNMKELHICAYNVLSCTHIICIMDKVRLAWVLDMCRYRIYSIFEYIFSD